MKNILETTLLEFDKSSFLIDLVKHDSGKLYIQIVQTINDRGNDIQTIKINPSIVTDLLKVLKNYQAKIRLREKNEVQHLTDSDQKKIQDRYLKGVPIKHIAIQFDQSKALIEMVLRNKGIQIISEDKPKQKKWKNWK